MKLTNTLERLLAEATRLTRAGSLRKATAAIQAALRGAAPSAPAAGSGNVRGVASAVNDSSDGVDVIDIESRVVDTWHEVAAPEASPAAAAGEFISGSHTEAAGMREYKLFIPPGHQGRSLPLVVMLHGCTQDPDDFAAGTGMNAAAHAQGFFVLYPAQAQSANVSRCWNWFKHNHQQRGRGEPAMLAGMTREVIERFGIDPKRVFVAGLSAGGAMAAILGQTYPELFAAVGVHSGLPVGAATDIQGAFGAMQSGAGGTPAGAHAPPTIVFHGDQDRTVNPVNGERVAAASTGVATRQFESASSAQGREVTRRIWRDAAERVVAEHWVVHGAGHAWSGGNAAGSYTDSQGPDATAEMLRFFFSIDADRA